MARHYISDRKATTSTSHPLCSTIHEWLHKNLLAASKWHDYERRRQKPDNSILWWSVLTLSVIKAVIFRQRKEFLTIAFEVFLLLLGSGLERYCYAREETTFLRRWVLSWGIIFCRLHKELLQRVISTEVDWSLSSSGTPGV